MCGKIAVVPFPTFMNSFAPDRRLSEKIFRQYPTEVFKDMPTPNNEKDMYREVSKRLNAAERLCRGLVVVSTPHKADSTSSSKIAPDCGIYPNGHASRIHDFNQYRTTDWSHLEITIVCKRDFAEDPFDNTTANAESFAEARKSALGQILSYAELVLQNQHRKHHFMIMFLGTFARLVCIDRACIFATRRFSYVENESWLMEFLWRYGKLTPGQRGFDPSARRLHPEESLAQLMREKRDAAVDGKIAVQPHILEAYKDSLDDKVPWWKLDVYDEDEDVTRSFVVGKPHFLAPGVRGRGTRCYIAQEVLKDDKGKPKLGDFVYLKDAWRVKHDEIEKEGTTLKFLNKNNVPYVPTVVCHGDLPDQLTDSRAKWMEYNPGQDYYPIKEHQHYRIVVKEIGKSLSRFKNSRELVRALADVVEAHEAAYNCGIIHRDLSGGNILLCTDSTGKWRGLLTDWELAKNILTTSHERQPERTGTWQFMSANVQDDPGRVVVIADELESILHILIFYTVRFCHHNLPDNDVGQFLYDYFDSRAPFSHGIRSGLAKRGAVEQGAISLKTYKGFPTTLQFIWPKKTPNANREPNYHHPLNPIISTLLAWFKAHYALAALASTEREATDSSSDDDDDVDVGDEKDHAFGGGPHADPDTPLEANIEMIKKQAEKLTTHLEVRRLLVDAIQQGKPWPSDNEKTADKRSKDGFVGDLDPESGESYDAFFGINRGEAEENELEDDVEDEEEAMQRAGDQETEGTLVEEDNPFAVDIGLLSGAALPQYRMPRSPPPPSSMTSTSSRKRPHDDSPKESTTPTKRSRLDDSE
ncbi:hypothetical protein L226DRAFT_615155 [Lentinus tigrinus ALCF2SS1-7]|uniref:Fungal-type protein kinase domain-containing protein n=1 Tax=Lentinus tigrinus ALCF2SS1-6 TaxID=1328759 RepID=A0A5C2S2Q2_9APHY|nr:hypothetical protein L227DRAFT_602347 [Lentinus tigrinus ALCF2SS1-6]RPD71859.1 hypothetical protein L226DRAFT_615155 [Lentinus tigrinus ALCF2SS1-7]